MLVILASQVERGPGSNRIKLNMCLYKYIRIEHMLRGHQGRRRHGRRFNQGACMHACCKRTLRGLHESSSYLLSIQWAYDANKQILVRCLQSHLYVEFHLFLRETFSSRIMTNEALTSSVKKVNKWRIIIKSSICPNYL